MFKRSSANYSLWPEQARPRRGVPLSLALGGFALGIICTVAIVNGASQLIQPMAMEPEPVLNAEAASPIPVYSSASKLVAARPAATDEAPQAPARERKIAKVTLPTIGRAVPIASETDGSGAAAVKMPPVRLTDNSGAAAETVKTTPKLIANGIKAVPVPGQNPAAPELTKLASRTPTPEAEAAAEPPKPAPVVEPRRAVRYAPRVRSRPQPVRRVERSRSRQYVRKPTQRHQSRPTYAARYRAGPVYGANGAPISGSFAN